MSINTLRKLARQDKHQLIFNSAKELAHIRLFRNDIDFTAIQILFLNWLNVYSSLYTDMALNKKHISEEVIADDIRTEAYLVWRKEEDKKENTGDTHTPGENNTSGLPTVVFTKKG